MPGPQLESLDQTRQPGSYQGNMTTNATTVKTPSARATAAEISAAGFRVHFECTNCGTLFGAKHGLAHCCNQPVTEFAYDVCPTDTASNPQPCWK